MALAWDCGGITTGPVTVPILIAYGIGVGSNRKRAAADGLLDGQREMLLLGAIPPSARLVVLRLADAALNYETFDLSSEVK